MTRSIVWFKTDLRLHDNETLVRAISASDEVVPVYCFDPSHFETTTFGTKKTGNFRMRFLLEALTDLDQRLRELGSGLLVVIGKPEEELVRLVKEYQVQKVFAKKEVAFEEISTREKVEAELWKNQCLLETYSTSTLYHAQDLPFPLKNIPDVFTTFRKQIEKESVIRPVFERPEEINSPQIPPLKLPTMEQFGLEPVVEDARNPYIFRGGETAGLERLRYYLFDTHAISTYKETRNGLTGSDFSSRFSAWLSLGCLSAREIYHEIKKYEAQFKENESTYWLVFELLWRDYFRFMMKKHRHQYFLLHGISSEEKKTPQHDPELFEKWKEGNTGDAFIDANMLELKFTGFMSNRGRQNVASYLCHDMNLDWRYGAAYFEEQLIDYDVCSNWGNWAYLAGVGNDPRGSRKFNTEKQANDYDKNKTFRNLWTKKI